MQRDTVRYAKRQWTWFAREPGIEWIDLGAVGGVDGAADAIAAALARGACSRGAGRRRSARRPCAARASAR
jgi:tRNA dimethylallyltransferase